LVTYKQELYHHGILGQKWGQRNGPPYPLKGGAYSRSESKKFTRNGKKKNSIYNKKHFDKVLKTGTNLSTLSYDPNRTKGADMFYATYEKLDKHLYNAAFNKAIPREIFDEQGNSLGTGTFLKYKISNVVKNDVKVASEDSGASSFRDLYETSRDFYNFVTDPDRMQKCFVSSKYKFRGYRESRDALERIRSGETPSDEDLQKVYRMFNYVIPSDGGGNTRLGNDVAKQRARFFKDLGSKGYGAVLDTNDAIYGSFKATAPVIVFSQEDVALGDISLTSTSSKRVSELVTVGRKVLGV
jgi:hypothetical protein